MQSLLRLFFLVLACALFAVPAGSSALLDEADKKCRAPTQYESYENKNIFFPNTFQERRGTQIVTIRSLYQMPCEDTTNNKIAVKGKCEAQNVCSGKLCLTTSGSYEPCKKTDVEVKETPNATPLPNTNTPTSPQNTGVQAPVNQSTDPRLLDVPSLQDPDGLPPSGSAKNVEEQLKNAAQGDGIWGDIAKWFGGEPQQQNIPISDAPGFDGNEIGGLRPEQTNSSFTPEDWIGPGVTSENTFTNTNSGQAEPDSFWSDAKAVAQAAAQAVKETAQDAYDAVRSALDASPFQERALDLYGSSNYDDFNNLGTQTFQQMRDELALQNQNLRDALDSQSELEDAYITAQNRLKTAATAAGAEIKDNRYVIPANASQATVNELQAALRDVNVRAEALDKAVKDSRATVLEYNTAATNYKNVLNDPVAKVFAQKILHYENAINAAQPAYDAWQANFSSANLSPEDLSAAPPPDYVLASTRLSDANRAFNEYMSGNHSPALQQKIEEARLGQGTGSAIFDSVASPFKSNAADTAERIKTDWEAIKSGTLLAPVHATYIAANSAFWLYHAAVGGVIDSTKTVLEGLGVPGFRDTPEGILASYADPGARAERMALATIDVATVATPFGRVANAFERTVLGAERGFETAAVTANIHAFRPAFTSELDNFGARAAGAYVKEEQLVFAQSVTRGVAPETAQATAYQNLYQNLGRIDIAQTPRGEQMLNALRREMDDLGIAVPSQNTGVANATRGAAQVETPSVFQPPVAQSGAHAIRQADAPVIQPAAASTQQVAATVDAELLARYMQENTAPLTSIKAAPLAEEVSVIQNYNNALNYSRDIAQNPTGVARLDALNRDKAITWRIEADQALQERGLGVRLAENSDASAVDAIYRLDTREIIAQRPAPRGGTEYDTLYEVVGVGQRAPQVASIGDTPIVSNVRPIPLTDTPVAQSFSNPFRFGGAPRAASQLDALPRFAPEVAVAERPFFDSLSNMFGPNRLQTPPVPVPITQTQLQTIERYAAIDSRLRELQRQGLSDATPVVRSYTNLKFDTANELWQAGFVVESATGNILKDNTIVAARGPLDIPGESSYVILANVEPSTFAAAPEAVSLVSPVAPASPTANTPIAPAAPSPIQRIVEPIRRAAVTTGLVTGLAFAPTHVEGAIATQLMEKSLPLTKITTTQLQTGVKSELEQLLTQLEPKGVQLVDATGAVTVPASAGDRLLTTIKDAARAYQLGDDTIELYVHKLAIETSDLNPNTVSHMGARGIGQVMPIAVNALKLGTTPQFVRTYLNAKYGSIDNAYRLVLQGGEQGALASVDLGLGYVAHLYHWYGLRGEAIIAAYNGGPRRGEILATNPTDSKGLRLLIKLPGETTNYVDTIRRNIALLRNGQRVTDQRGNPKTGPSLNEFLQKYVQEFKNTPPLDLRVVIAPRNDAAFPQLARQQNPANAQVAQTPTLPPVQGLDLPPLSLSTVVQGEFPPIQTANIAPLEVADVVGTFDAPVIPRQGPVFTAETMPTNWNPANLLAAEKVTPGPVELPKLQTADLPPLQPTIQAQVVATGDLADILSRKAQIETQLSQAQSDLSALQARIARAQNVQNGTVNIRTAQAGLDVLRSLWSAPDAKQKAVLVRGIQAATQLGRIVNELGNAQLAGQINGYVRSLNALLVPANQTLANQNSAVAQGTALIQQSNAFLANAGNTVDKNIAALRAQENQLKIQVEDLNTTLAQIRNDEKVMLAQQDVPPANAIEQPVRVAEIEEQPIVSTNQPEVTTPTTQSVVATVDVAPQNQFQVAYQQFKDYWGPVSLRAYLSPLAPGVPLTPAAIQRVLRPRDPEFEAGGSLAVSDTNAGSANTNLQNALARREIALRDVENAIAELQASVSQPLPPAVVEQVKSQLATNISAVEATAGFLQPLPANSPVKTFSVVPESQLDSFVLASTPGTVRLYRGLGRDFDPNFSGPDPYFTPNQAEALNYARSNTVFGSEPQLLIADIDVGIWRDMQTYRQLQGVLGERYVGLGEITSGYIQLPKDWFNPTAAKPSLVDEIAGMSEVYARQTDAITDRSIELLNQVNAEERRVALAFQDANPGQYWGPLGREAQDNLLKQDAGYISATRELEAQFELEKNVQKTFAEKFAAERTLRQGIVPAETNSTLSLPAPTGERSFVFTGPTWNPKPNINTAVTPDVIALPAPVEVPAWYAGWSEWSIAAEGNVLVTLDSLAGVRGPTVVPTIDMRPLVPRVADVIAPTPAPTSNAIQLELPLDLPARQLEFDFGQNNALRSTESAVQGELPLAGNLGQQLELPFNQPAPTTVAQPVPAVSNAPVTTAAPAGLRPMDGMNYAFNPATGRLEEIRTPLPGGGAGAGGTPPPSGGVSGAADADAGAGGFSWSKATLEAAKFLCYNGWVRIGVCTTLGAFVIASPDSQQNQAAAPKSNLPATPPKQNPPANQPQQQQNNSDVNNPAQQAAPPAQQQTPPPDPTKQEMVTGKVFDVDTYCVTSINPVLIQPVKAGTPFPGVCLNNGAPQKASPGQVLDVPYYCVTSIQPVQVTFVAAKTPFPANCYNSTSPPGPVPQYVPPPSGPASPASPSSGIGQSPLTRMFSNLLGQYLGQQLQQQSRSQSQQPAQQIQAATSTPKASVALVANPSTVQSGGTSTLWWASIRTSECLAYAPDGTQIGSAEESGMAEAVNVTQTSTYTVKCKGINGENVSASAQVTVAP